MAFKTARSKNENEDVFFELYQDRGEIVLAAERRNGQVISKILTITKTGKLDLCPGVSSETKIRLDQIGRIVLK